MLKWQIHIPCDTSEERGVEISVIKNICFKRDVKTRNEN